MGKRELYRNKQALANAAPLAQAHSQPLGITIGARTSNVKMPKEAIPAIYYEKILKYMKTKEMLNDVAGACTKYLYKPSDWKYYYFEHRWKEYSNVRRALRKLVQMGTLQVLLRGKYYKEETDQGSSSVNVTEGASSSNQSVDASASEEVLQVKEEEEEVETFVIGGRTLTRKKYIKTSEPSSSSNKKAAVIAAQEEEIQIEEEETINHQATNKKKNKKNKKNKKKKDPFESDEDDIQQDEEDDGTFDGFEITRDEDRPQLYELNEWKDDPKKKKNKKQNKKQSKKQSSSLEIEQDGFVKEEEGDEKGIPSKAVHIDFNNIKKIVKATEKIDCVENEAVQNITLNLARKSKEESSSSQKTIIQVVKGDMLETAISLRKNCKLNPLVLVSGSQTVPGGSFAKGGNTQEEDFCRRSSLTLSIADPYRFDENREWTYPLPEFGGIYAPNIVVLRGPKSDGYAFLDRTWACSMFITYPYVNPPTEKRKVADPNTVVPNEDDADEEVPTESFLSTKLANSMKKKIAAYFDVALKKGHDSLVIGALGCENTHSNPAYHIAQLFREVLSSEIFKDKFKVVIFSILVDNETDSKLANEGGTDEVEEVEENDEVEDQHDLLANPLIDSTAVERKNNLSVFSKLFHGKEEAPTAEEFIPTIECK